MPATGVDFTAVSAVVNITTVLAAISGAAALKFGPRFTKWAYNQVIGFFKG